jgi:hypothetical protein
MFPVLSQETFQLLDSSNVIRRNVVLLCSIVVKSLCSTCLSHKLFVVSSTRILTQKHFTGSNGRRQRRAGDCVAGAEAHQEQDGSQEAGVVKMGAFAWATHGASG